MPKSAVIEVTLDDLIGIAKKTKPEKKNQSAKKRTVSPKTKIRKRRAWLKEEIEKTFADEANLWITTVLEKLKVAAKHPVKEAGVGLVVEAKVEVAKAYNSDHDGMERYIFSDDEMDLLSAIEDKLSKGRKDNPIKVKLKEVTEEFKAKHFYLVTKAVLVKE